MGQLSKRAYSLNLNGLLVTDLRITFSIIQTLKPEPNTSEIVVYNLNPQHRTALQKAGIPVQLDAGYGNDIATIFIGQMRKARQTRVDAGGITQPSSKSWDERKGVNWESHFRSGDSEKEIREGKVSKSWTSTTPVLTVIQYLVQQLGNVGIGNALTQAAKGDVNGVLTTYANGFVAHGNTYQQIKRVFSNLGYDVSVKNGVLQVLAPGDTVQTTAVLLSPTTGLVSSPEAGENGIVTCLSLLQAGLYPGRQVVLQSREFNGAYRVEKVTHAGDTHQGDWQSRVELSSIDQPSVTGNLSAGGQQ